MFQRVILEGSLIVVENVPSLSVNAKIVDQWRYVEEVREYNISSPASHPKIATPTFAGHFQIFRLPINIR